MKWSLGTILRELGLNESQISLSESPIIFMNRLAGESFLLFYFSSDFECFFDIVFGVVLSFLADFEYYLNLFVLGYLSFDSLFGGLS